jgi:hypothetical protein
MALDQLSWTAGSTLADWRLFGEPNRDSVHVIGPRGLLRDISNLDVIANKL